MDFQKTILIIFLFFLSPCAWAVPAFQTSEGPEAPTLLKADSMEGDRITNTLTANGHVEANKGNSTVFADEMIYDKNSKILHANGNVKAKNFEIGNLKANKAEVKDDFSSGKFFDSKMVFIDGSYLSSPEIERKTPEITTLKKSIYSICPDESIAENNDLAGKKFDMLSIKSSKTTIDRKDDEMRINHGIIRVYSVPVFYTPYLKTSLSKERKSGFLPPSYTKNTNLGTAMLVPYYFNIAPNMDLTVTPSIGIATKQKIITNDFRHLTTYGLYTGKFEIANNEIKTKNDKVFVNRSDKKYRWYLTGKGLFDFTKDVGLDFDINTLGDTNYLRDYKNAYFLNHTVSKVNLDYIHGRDYHAVKTIRFQELEFLNQTNQAPLALPVIDSHIESKPMLHKERFALTSNMVNIQRKSGLQYRRATFVPEVNVPLNLRGNLFNFGTKLQTDFYSLDSNYKFGESHRGYSQSEVNYKPEMSFSWKLPLIKRTKSNSLVIEPMASIVTSSYGRKISDFPNEDSSDTELTVSNLFLNDKIAGYDRNEVGQRANYGVKSSLFSKYGEFGLTIGQSYRKTYARQDVAIRGFGQEKKSNLVGQAMYKSGKHFSIIYAFQLNESSYRNEVNEVTPMLSFDRITLSANYLLLKKTTTNLIRKEQLSFSSVIKISNRWNITMNAVKDIANKRMLQRGFILTRDGCCTIFGVSYAESNPSNLVKAQKSFGFNLTFKNL